MKFTTHTGSTYEVDDSTKQVRRLTGKADPTPRQGKDGAWRKYADITEARVGQPVVIFWTDEVKPFDDSPPGAMPSTMTSLVTSIEQ